MRWLPLALVPEPAPRRESSSLGAAGYAAGADGARPHGDRFRGLRVVCTYPAQEAVDLTGHRIGVAAEQPLSAGQLDQYRAGDVIGQVTALGERKREVFPAV